MLSQFRSCYVFRMKKKRSCLFSLIHSFSKENFQEVNFEESKAHRTTNICALLLGNIFFLSLLAFFLIASISLSIINLFKARLLERSWRKVIRALRVTEQEHRKHREIWLLIINLLAASLYAVQTLNTFHIHNYITTS